MNTQNQLTTTDGPAGSLALDPRSAPWLPIDTAPRDETEVLIKTRIGVVSAWFHAEPGECYHWVCYDDAFTIDGDDGSVTHWMPIPSLPNTQADR